MAFFQGCNNEIHKIAPGSFGFPPKKYRILKSNRWRFCTQLLYCTSSAVQGCQLKESHLFNLKTKPLKSVHGDVAMGAF